MGESDRYIDYKIKKISFGADGNSLMMLIAINAVVFIILSFLQIVYYILQSPPGAFENEVLPWFIMPAKLSALAHKPWTFFTHMFSHMGIIFILTNLLWLYTFGYIFQQITGNRKLIPLYIYGGMAGGAAFICSFYLIPPLSATVDFSSLQGASAATMCIAVATTTLAPDYRFFRMINGGIPLWVLTLLFVIIDFAGIANQGAAYNIAHLAGGLTGFIFIFRLRKGKDWSLWMNNVYDWLINLFNPDKKKPHVPRIKEKVFYKTGNQKPFVKKANITQQRIDEILDKINQQGYHLLTDEEKNILKRAAESDL